MDEKMEAPGGEPPPIGKWRLEKAFMACIVGLMLIVFVINLVYVTNLFIPGIGSRGAAPRTQCKNNLKQFGIALDNYHETYGTYPPAYTVDENGNRLHSWRSLILPMMDQNPIYTRIDFSKPWDHPANAEVRNIAIQNLHCVSAEIPETSTTYQVVISPRGLFYDDKSKSLSDVTDDHDQTLLVVEVPDDQAVHWMSPYDTNEQTFLNFSEKSQLQHKGGFQAVMVDGSVRFIKADMPADRRKAMISIAADDGPAFVIRK